MPSAGALERGEPVSWQTVWNTWSRWQMVRSRREGGYWCLVRFGLLLALAATGWVVVSASLITVLSPVRIATPMDFRSRWCWPQTTACFVCGWAWAVCWLRPFLRPAWCPLSLLLDRRVSVNQAVLTSWMVVLENPVAMAWWAGLILLFTLLGLGSLLLGLVVVMPMLGHASWHAYRDLVMRPPLRRAICLAPWRRAAAGVRKKKNVVIFGYTEEQLAHFSHLRGGGLYRLHGVHHLRLARDSKAGKFGTFVIFLGLGCGLCRLPGQNHHPVVDGALNLCVPLWCGSFGRCPCGASCFVAHPCRIGILSADVRCARSTAGALWWWFQGR